MVALTIVVLIAAAIIIGKHSVKVQPRKKLSRRNKEERDYSEPLFKGEKAEWLKASFGARYYDRKLGDSEVILSSKAMDHFWDIVAAGVFWYVFTKEHFRGIEQALINGQTNTNGDVIWATIGASLIVGAIAFVVGVGFEAIRRFTERLVARRIVDYYLSVHHRRPRISERFSLSFLIRHTIWAFGECRDELVEEINETRRNLNDEAELQRIASEMNGSFCSIEGTILPFRKRA
jgi:hypothetical protein